MAASPAADLTGLLMSGEDARSSAARPTVAPVDPSQKPMLATLVRELPRGDVSYEPK